MKELDAGDDAQSALTAGAAPDADTEEPAPPSGLGDISLWSGSSSPSASEEFRRTAEDPGFANVASGPLVRSFYHSPFLSFHPLPVHQREHGGQGQDARDLPPPGRNDAVGEDQVVTESRPFPRRASNVSTLL